MTTTETPVAAILARLDEARDLINRFAGLGAITGKIELTEGQDQAPISYLWADVKFTFFRNGEECERIAAALLDAYPAATIKRGGEGGSFMVTCPGRPSWSAYFSESVCTRVQVGTRTKTIPDPVAMRDVPLIEVEEPVYEWRCSDALADMAATK